jgi:hypothetical protein
MTDKHTPGPWKYGHYGFAFWVGPEFNHPHVCVVGDRRGENDDPNRENARLIAAAPDLLESCKALVSLVLYGAEDWQNVVKNARAAIAKATGGVND